MTTIDLNADLGEGDACDLELLQIVSSCNIACGGHAGDDASMLATVRAAKDNGVAIGAYPSYPDRAGFGRRSYFLSGDDLQKSLIKQIDRLAEIAKGESARLTHVKPHGALYSDAATDAALAELLITVVQQCAKGAYIVGPSGSAIEIAANNAGVVFVAEAFVDRAYLPNGTLVPRSEPNAVHADLNTISTQATRLATNRTVTAQDGTVIEVAADTLCIHGDTPRAAEAARAVRDVLQANGVEIRVTVHFSASGLVRTCVSNPPVTTS